MAHKWEYRQEIFQGVEIMNQWGAEGWELAGFFGKDGSFMILKRPLVTRGVPRPTEQPAEQQRSRPAAPSRGAPARSPSKKKEFI